MSKAPTSFEEWYVKSSYQQFIQREGAPMYEGSALENLATLPLADWERRGGQVAYTQAITEAIHFFKTQKQKVCKILSRELAPLIGLQGDDEVDYLQQECAKLLSLKPCPHPLAV